MRYYSDYGAKLIVANATELKMECHNRSDTLIDIYTQTIVPPLVNIVSTQLLKTKIITMVTF